MEIRASGIPISQDYHPKSAGRVSPESDTAGSTEALQHAISSEKTMLEPEQVKQLFFVLIGHGVHAVSSAAKLGAHVNTVV